MDSVIMDVKTKYIGSILGSFWVVFLPLLQLSIYAVLYAFIFRVRPSGLDEFGYVLLVFSGLVPLLSFSEMLNGATGSLSTNKSILLNTVFPAELIPLRAALAASVPGIAGLCITIFYGLTLGRSGIAILVIPFFWILL